MIVSRVNGMLKAGVGVRRELIELLVALLNPRVHPVVRMIGSVGQGDLSEMADIGKVLIGRGWAEYEGETLPGEEALARAGLEPIALGPKEALGLISSNGVTMGRGSLVLVDAADLVESMQIAAALSFEAFAANLSVIHPAAARMRPHSGLETAMSRLRELLEDTSLWRPGAARNLQDPLSIRCVPQTHGALYDALSVARGMMEIELNSAADNPLVLVDEGVIVSVGNFDVTSLAMAFDYLRLGIAHAAQVANERVQKLLWQHFTGLPTGLAQSDGPTGGLRPLGRSFAALASEARFLANPVSLDYRGQLAEGIEDHASMAPLAVSTTSTPGQPGAPPRRAGADRRGAGRRPAGRPGAAGRRDRPRLRAGPGVREHAAATRPSGTPTSRGWPRWSATAGWPAASPAWPARARRCPSTSRRGSRGDAGHAVRGPGARRRAAAPLGRQPADPTVAELASEAGMPTSTAYRLLAELEQHGLVQRGPDSTVALGTRLVALGRTAEAGLRERLVAPAAPVMEELSEEVGETVILTAPCALEAIVLHVVEAERHSVRLSYTRFRRGPMHRGASGKILAAFLEPDERRRLIDAVGEPGLEAELDAVRARRLAVTVAELDEGAAGGGGADPRPARAAGRRALGGRSDGADHRASARLRAAVTAAARRVQRAYES